MGRPTLLEARCALSGAARQALEAGDVEACRASLERLAASKGMAEEDRRWVAENEAAVAAVAAAPQPPPSSSSASSGIAFFPRIADVHWRVDVSLSTSSLERVLKPSVMMRLTLTDGAIHTFEMSADQLLKLRYGAAKALRAMQQIERHPIMRIVEG